MTGATFEGKKKHQSSLCFQLFDAGNQGSPLFQKEKPNLWQSTFKHNRKKKFLWNQCWQHRGDFHTRWNLSIGKGEMGQGYFILHIFFTTLLCHLSCPKIRRFEFCRKWKTASSDPPPSFFLASFWKIPFLGSF